MNLGFKANRVTMMHDDKFFSVNLARLRQEAGYSQAELADVAGVSHHTVFRAESKGMIPLRENIIKIARALGVSPDDLFKDPTEKPHGIGTASTQSRAQSITDIITLLPALNEDQLRNILTLATGYADAASVDKASTKAR